MKKNRRVLILATLGVTTVALGGGLAALRFGLLGADDLGAAPEVSGGPWFNVARPLTPDELRGRPVLYQFWATWCPPCLELIPKLNELQQRYAEKGLVIIAVTKDSPDIVSGFVKRFGIEYPVRAAIGTNVTTPKTLPYAMLVAPDGTIAWQGDSRFAAMALAWMMSDATAKAYPKIIDIGNVHGFDSKRPDFAADYDYANCRIAMDSLLERLPRVTEEELQEVYEYHWKNLPTDSWEGDVMTAEAAANLLEIYIAIRDDPPAAIMQSLCAEARKRLAFKSTTRSAQNVGRFCSPGDSEVIRSLGEMVKREPNPSTRLAIEKTLERLDPTRPSIPDPESPLLAARARYERLKRSWKTKLLGLPADLAKYDDYRDTLTELSSRESTETIAQRLFEDYRRRDGGTAGDLLIRDHILDFASSMPYLYQLPKKVERRLQEGVLAILLATEPDWKLRQQIVITQDGVGFDTLDRETLLQRIDAMLSVETSRTVRAHLEDLKLRITDPKYSNNLIQP